LALAWLLGLLIVLLLLMAGPRLNAQSEQSISPASIEASLIDSLSASATLRQALLDQRASRQDLEIAYAELKQQQQLSQESAEKRISELLKQLHDSGTLSDDLRAEISRLMKLLTESKAESESLSKAFEAYRNEMGKQVADLTRDYARARRWAVGFGVTSVIAVIVSVVLALK